MMRLAAWFIRFAYFVCALFPRRDKVSFLSRQSSRPFDFALLEPEIRRSLPGYDIVWSCVPESGSFGPLLAFSSGVACSYFACMHRRRLCSRRERSEEP